VTIGSLWSAIDDGAAADDALAWPPDLFALVDRVLEASEAYRLIVSPPPGTTFAGIGAGAAVAAREWWEWLDGSRDDLPSALTARWHLVRDALDTCVERLSRGDDWPVTEALLALHAIADEACAGLGSATAAPPGPGTRFRAAARELLAETGSLSTVRPGVLRVLPRCRVGLHGMSIHSLSRHICVRGPQVDVEWHRMLSRPSGAKLPEAHANGLLLPWPLRVRARDFAPADCALPGMDTTAFGFFTFEPEEHLDLDLLQRVLEAAVDEAGTIDFVIMPESAVTPDELAPLEALVGAYGVWNVIAGVREPGPAGGLGANWVHIGVRQEMVWRHAVQHKHHRWCLDGRQLQQYHLGGALSPTMRWWEAVSIPRRSLQVVDEGAVTIVPLLCEDLARLEPVADLVRSIGPSLVVTLLLDGPQLASRWTARYASVLADDPGSAVCTLTSYGMVRRCRPPGCEPSNVVGLWKDASGELTELELADGAQALLIATTVVASDTTTADGRHHPGTTSTLMLAGVQPLRAAPASSVRPRPAVVRADDDDRAQPLLDEVELSKATSWAEAIAETAAGDPLDLDGLLTHALDCRWRGPLHLADPSPALRRGVKALRRHLPDPPTLEGVAAAVQTLRRSSDPASIVTGTLVGIALEQRLAAEVVAHRKPPEILTVLAPMFAPPASTAIEEPRAAG
jgi:hypothetical protein